MQFVIGMSGIRYSAIDRMPSMVEQNDQPSLDIYTLLDVKYLSCCSETWGNIRSCELFSQRPCTRSGLIFIIFSTVSSRGLWAVRKDDTQ